MLIEIGGRLGCQHFVHSLALSHHRRHFIANGEDHVAMRDQCGSIDHRSVTRNDLRLGTGHADRDAKPFQHPLQRSAVGAVNIRELDASGNSRRS